MRARTAATAPLLLCVLVTAGCSYSTKRLTDFPSARTIAVVPFQNTGYYRDMELRLTQAVVTEIRARTDLALTSPQKADLLIRGTMTAREWAIGLDNMGRVLQRRLEGFLTFEVVQRVGGRILRKTTVSANQEFRTNATASDGEIAALQTRGTEGWTRRIAEQVVQMLERGF